MVDKTPSQQIDDIIANCHDWRGDKLARLRAIILETNPGVIEEVKWKKPSKPEGVAVWSSAGILCVADVLKSAVRLTFPKGASMQDKRQLFNTRLDSQSVRAIDFFDNETIDADGLQSLIREAIAVNLLK